MSLNLAVAQRAQYLDSNGKPLSGGRVTYYEAVGTDILKNVYADPDGLIPLPNPLLLDEGGFVPPSGVFYGLGNYTLLIEYLVNPGSPTPVYAEEYTIPNVPGTIDSSVTGIQVSYINAVENIPNVTPNSCDLLFAPTYYQNEDSYDVGGGWFKWEPLSTATPDLGVVFATTASPAIGRFIRVFNENIIQSAMFGVAPNRGSAMNSRILAGASYATTHNYTYVLNTGDIECVGDLVLNGSKVVIEDGFKLKRQTALTATKLTINATEIEKNGILPFVDSQLSQVVLNSTQPMNLMIEWWGCVGSCTDAFVWMITTPSKGTYFFTNGISVNDLNHHNPIRYLLAMNSHKQF